MHFRLQQKADTYNDGDGDDGDADDDDKTINIHEALDFLVHAPCILLLNFMFVRFIHECGARTSVAWRLGINARNAMQRCYAAAIRHWDQRQWPRR